MVWPKVIIFQTILIHISKLRLAFRSVRTFSLFWTYLQTNKVERLRARYRDEIVLAINRMHIRTKAVEAE